VTNPKPPLPPEAQAEIDAFDKANADYCKSLERDYTPPPQLFHYTSAAGLLGIIETGCLWLTDIKDANDPSELVHGVELCVEELFAAAEGGPPEVLAFARIARDVAPMVRKNQHFHVCCLSPDGDDLDQWRRYGNDGKGFAVGFNGPMLVSGFTGRELAKGGSIAFDIDYNDDQLRAQAKGLVAKVLPHIRWPRKYEKPVERFGEAIPQSMKELSAILFSGFMNIACTHKHDAYKAERETRLLELTGLGGPGNRLQHRLRGLDFLPYTEYRWAKQGEVLPLMSIRSGPAVDREKGRAFLIECMNRLTRRLSLPDGSYVQLGYSTKPYVSR
jgi:hypothetical protein